MKKANYVNFWIFVFFLAAFLFVSNGHFGGDGLVNYFTAESLVLDSDFFICDRPFAVGEMRYEIKGQLTPEGRRVSSYGLGMAIILVPFYFIGHLLSHLIRGIPHDYITQFAVSLANPAILSLLSVVLFGLMQKMGYSKKISFFAVLIYSFCTMNIAYVRSGFSEPVIALLITIAALKIFDYSKNGNAVSAFIITACLGYTMFIKKNSFILLPPFVLYFLYLILRNKQSYLKTKALHIMIFVFPLAVSIAAILLQNKLLYGGLLKTEYGTISGMLSKIRTDGYPVKGLYYYLISSGKGYFVYNVAMILGLFAIKDFFKKYKAYAIFIVSLLLFNLLFYSAVFVRGSLFSWGPRYLFPTMPLFVLFLGEFMNKNSFLRRKLAIISFASLGFIIQLPSMIVNYSKYLFFIKEKLNLPEYLINFMPELSPIKGSWLLLFSLLKHKLTNTPTYFVYNPDFRFITPLRVSLEGYDVADLWYVNVLKVAPNMQPFVLISVFLLLSIIAISYIKITKNQ